MSSERTEAPTPRRRAEARKKGQIAKSPEVNTAFILLIGFFVLQKSGPRIFMAISTLMRTALGGLDRPDLTPTALTHGGLGVIWLVTRSISPVILGLLFAGILANVVQVGFFFSWQPLVPDVQRINPISGFQRTFSKRGLEELAKTAAKVGVVSFIAFQAVWGQIGTVSSLSQMPLVAGLQTVAHIGLGVGLRAGAAILVLAAADFIFQRHEMEQNMRMSRQEITEEMRSMQGSPQMKARMRAQQRQMATQRMMQDVPKADVVITNPTHFAVALRYDSKTMNAPIVLAKGQRLVAQRMREIARKHDVLVLENRPLARSLFRLGKIGKEVPISLYQTVAEVLAFVYALKGKR